MQLNTLNCQLHTPWTAAFSSSRAALLRHILSLATLSRNSAGSSCLFGVCFLAIRLRNLVSACLCCSPLCSTSLAPEHSRESCEKQKIIQNKWRHSAESHIESTVNKKKEVTTETRDLWRRHVYNKRTTYRQTWGQNERNKNNNCDYHHFEHSVHAGSTVGVSLSLLPGSSWQTAGRVQCDLHWAEDSPPGSLGSSECEPSPGQNWRIDYV